MTRPALAALCALAAALSACSPAHTASDGRLQIVASTDVYGAIARAVAGRRADVTSIIADPSQDPHEYQASARDQLAVSRADVLIENGGGYDDFLPRLQQAAGKPGATTVRAVTLHAGPIGDNVHVWYDFATVERLATRLAAVLAAHRPGAAGAFHAAAARFVGRVQALRQVEAGLRRRFGGTAVAVTEPVPDYLLAACGLVDRTPAQFQDSVSAGTDVSASVLARTLALFDDHTVHVLVYNAQTSGAETLRVQAAAAANGIPAVPVTETVPAGASYLSWMHANLTALASALRRAASS